MRSIEFVTQLGEELQAGYSVCLMLVTEHSKGSPGKRGFKMALSTSGNRFGTIGGGIMEHEILQRASIRLSQPHPSPVEQIPLFHNRQAPKPLQSGLICAGYQKILLTTLTPAMTPQVQNLANQLTNLEPAPWFITPQGLHFGIADTQLLGIADTQLLGIADTQLLGTADTQNLWEEDLTPNPVVYVFGAGHVGQALCQVLQNLDFPVISFDHREEPWPGAKSSHASKAIWGNSSPISQHLKWGQRRFACVVSPSKDTDVAFLREILPHPWEFVGVMGSPSKIQAIKEDLRNSGCLQTHIEQITHPIGLAVGSRTPAEIAVSIAAQLISLRNSLKSANNAVSSKTKP